MTFIHQQMPATGHQAIQVFAGCVNYGHGYWPDIQTATTHLPCLDMKKLADTLQPLIEQLLGVHQHQSWLGAPGHERKCHHRFAGTGSSLQHTKGTCRGGLHRTHLIIPQGTGKMQIKWRQQAALINNDRARPCDLPAQTHCLIGKTAGKIQAPLFDSVKLQPWLQFLTNPASIALSILIAGVIHAQLALQGFNELRRRI